MHHAIGESFAETCRTKHNAPNWQMLWHSITCMGRRPLLTKDVVLVGLQRLTAMHGRQPSVEELRRELGVASTRTIFRYLQILEDDGAIERRPGAPGVKLIKSSSQGVQTRAIPIIGRVPAG